MFKVPLNLCSLHSLCRGTRSMTHYSQFKPSLFLFACVGAEQAKVK